MIAISQQNNDVILASRFILDQRKLQIPHLTAGLCFYSCQYDEDLYCVDLFDQLKVSYPEHLGKAVKKRQAEYLAGRYCAKLALKDLGVENFDVSTGQHRSPVWPQSVLGSITHSQCKAYAAVAYCRDYKYIGIDYEKVIDTKIAENICSMIMNESEAKLMRGSCFDFSLALTIIFSAKESLFKALYPYVGQYFDFSAASVIKLSKEELRFKLKLNQSLSKNLLAGKEFEGWFYADAEHVLTVISLS